MFVPWPRRPERSTIAPPGVRQNPEKENLIMCKKLMVAVAALAFTVSVGIVSDVGAQNIVKDAVDAAGDVAEGAVDAAGEVAKGAGEVAGEAVEGAGKAAGAVAEGAGDAAECVADAATGKTCGEGAQQ